MIQLKYKKLHPDAVQPTRANDGDSGWDIRSLERVIVNPNSITLVRTGLAVEIPKGYELQIRGKSGVARNQGLGIAQGVGTIDCGYRGEVGVLLKNHGPTTKSIDPGEMIAQLVLNEVPESEFIEVKELSDTARGEKGLGSTPTKAVQAENKTIDKKK